MGVDAQMLVKNRGRHLSADDVLRLSVDIAEAFGHDAFFITNDDEPENWGRRHALEIVTEYQQDGEDILPEKGEQFIEVHLAGRYYGPGYERGNLPKYISIANWLEVRIPNSSIFYGGDSSGICAEPFDAKGRAKMWAHFCQHGHRPYTGAFGSFNNTGVTLCSFCKTPMTDTGGGSGDTYLYCAGCGKRRIKIGKTGELVKVEHNEDYFSAHKRVRPQF